MDARARSIDIIGRALIGLAVVAAIVGLRGGFASAATGAVTDYANYPGELPAGCSAEDALEDLSFSSPRATADDLRRLDIRPGDEITMSWSNYSDDCEGTEVSLAIAESASASFDMHTDQELLNGYATCGDGCGPIDGTYRLRVTVPATDVCMFQIDAVLGRPLAVVGPSGSYYGSALRRDGGPDMLISARHVAASNVCVASTPSTTEPAAVPPTSVSPPTSEPAVVSPATVAQAPTAVLDDSETLPFTGAGSAVLATVAATMLAAGAAMMIAARRMESVA